MSEKEEALKNEFRFASSSIVAHIVRGVLVGIVVGCVVSSFRFLIEHIFHFCSRRLQGDAWSTTLFTCYAIGLWGDRTDCWSPYSHQSGYQGIRNSASRSGAKGLLAVSWWDTLWKKYILGVLAIGSGLMLGVKVLVFN